MRKKILVTMLAVIMLGITLMGCGSQSDVEGTDEVQEQEEMVSEDENADNNDKYEIAQQEKMASENYDKGRNYLYGLNGQGKDLEEAYNCFIKALELGKTEANFYLGVLYDWESYTELNYE